MNVLEMVVVVALIATVGSIIIALINRPRKIADTSSPPAAGGSEEARLRQEIAQLHQRLAVLERLATDDHDAGARLDREIEQLRERS